jgi:hypothetical protein
MDSTVKKPIHSPHHPQEANPNSFPSLSSFHEGMAPVPDTSSLAPLCLAEVFVQQPVWIETVYYYNKVSCKVPF